MKYFFTLAMLIALGTGCKQKILSGAELQNKLIETMQNFLDNEGKEQGVQFKVKEVKYYVDVNKKMYDCEFNVNMHTNKTDTVGIMTAAISNDFNKVTRMR